MTQRNLFKFLLLLSSFCHLISCKKGDTPSAETPANERCKIKKITYYPQAGTQREFEVKYKDSLISNLIETTQLPYGSPDYIINCFYDNKNIDGFTLLSRIELYHQNDPQIAQSQTFNNSAFGGSFSRGSVDSIYDNNQFQYWGQRNYYYNTSLITSKPIMHQLWYFASHNTSESYTWANNDITKAVVNEPNIAGTDIITYDTTKINKLNQLEPELFLQGIYNNYFWLPNLNYFYLSKHMIKSISSNNPNRTTKIGDFTYTYNSAGLVREIVFNGRIITKYEYTCD